jgi:hypothetical protein
VESERFFAEPWSKLALRKAMRQKAMSSTFVEVLNAIQAVMTFASNGARVKLFTDSLDGFYILEKHYSSSVELLDVLHNFDLWCIKHNVVLADIVWIEREKNTKADLLSHGNVCAFQDQVSTGYCRVIPSDALCRT